MNCNSTSPSGETQRLLFGDDWQQPTPPTGKVDTSRAAAKTTASRAAGDRARILDALACSADGVTCDELQVALDMLPQTCSARCNDLLRAGLIRRSGRKRPTRTGASAHVYELMRRAG